MLHNSHQQFEGALNDYCGVLGTSKTRKLCHLPHTQTGTDFCTCISNGWPEMRPI